MERGGGLLLERATPAAAADAWDGFAAAGDNVFATRAWAEAWWRHAPAGREDLTAVARDGSGRVRAVLPLALWLRRPVRVARFVGHGPGDELGPLCAPGDEELAAAALHELLRQARVDLFVGEQLSGAAGWARRLGGDVVARGGSPVVALDRDWESLLASWSPKLRRDLRGDERKLTERHGLRFRLADDPERLDDDLALCFRLHRARFGASESAFARAEAFHRDFARTAAGRGWLRLWFAELDGVAAGAWYGFRFNGVDAHYQVGRDPAWSKWGVGTLLTGHTIREAAADGMREYRFLRGGEAYKYRFATGDPMLETVALARTGRGRVALALAAAARRLRATARGGAPT